MRHSGVFGRLKGSAYRVRGNPASRREHAVAGVLFSRLPSPERVTAAAHQVGLKRLAVIPSPVTGMEGNQEFLALFEAHG